MDTIPADFYKTVHITAYVKCYRYEFVLLLLLY